MVENITTNRMYSAGNIIGILDIMQNNSKRGDAFIAITDLYVLKFSKNTFLHIVKDHPEIMREVNEMVEERHRVKLQNGALLY